jgi:hypothetical protein
MTFTADQIALQAHIEAKNAEALAWAAEVEGRWTSTVVSDPAHWAEQGITTVAQYDHHMAAMTHYEVYRDIHGIKPRWIDYDSMTTEEIEEELDEMSNGAVREYEAAIEAAIAAGAPDRETAIRWMGEAENA